MKKLFSAFICWVIRIALSLRYRVTLKGIEQIEKGMPNPGGILFLPNHPAMVDPIILSLILGKKFRIRPVVVEYIYRTPGVRWIMDIIKCVAIPNFETANNSFKKIRGDQAIQTVIDGIKKGESFLIYPGGRLKRGAPEVLGGASGLHTILQKTHDANIVLVRTTGLWGSRFSRALTGKVPNLLNEIKTGIKIALSNFLFFTPRRDVCVEFIEAPSDFPYNASRLELNHYLEEWFNRPFASFTDKGEPLSLVSYSWWHKKFPEVTRPSDQKQVQLDDVPQAVRERVIQEISHMTKRNPDDIRPDMDLSVNLGMDSLDIASLVIFLADRYDVKGITPEDLTTVEAVMIAAVKPREDKEEAVPLPPNMNKWSGVVKSRSIHPPKGETIPEAFLNSCRLMGKLPACADERSGILSYQDLKLRVILLASYIRRLPGKRIGVLLPASVGATVVILATYFAGKIPVMINWTTGPRHLKSVKESSGFDKILSSWAFLENLSNIDFGGLEPDIVLLEDLLIDLGFCKKLGALLKASWSDSVLISSLGLDQIKESDEALLLFTSGSEGIPKGVPLTHKNLLINQIDGFHYVNLKDDDILYGILPPFHAFGINVNSLFPIMTGIRVAFYPDPTNSKGVVRGITRWGSTFICGTPTFIKGILKEGTKEQLKTLRLIIVGAEKAPQDLFEKVKSFPGVQITEGYGVTEASPIVSINLSGNPSKGVGQPFPNVRIKIIHPDTNELLGMGERGHIIVSGPNVFNGYLDKSRKSPFISLEGEQWYMTGDLGYLDQENNLIISGRIKRFVKIGGEMISLVAMEETITDMILKKNPGLSEGGPPAAVVSQESEGEKARIVLFTVASLELERVNDFLKENGFSNLSKLSDIQIIEKIPLTGTGKINYRSLESQLTVVH